MSSRGVNGDGCNRPAGLCFFLFFCNRTTRWCIDEMPMRTVRTLRLGVPDLLSCQGVLVGRLLPMDLVVPKKQANKTIFIVSFKTSQFCTDLGRVTEFSGFFFFLFLFIIYSDSTQPLNTIYCGSKSELKKKQPRNPNTYPQYLLGLSLAAKKANLHSYILMRDVSLNTRAAH